MPYFRFRRNSEWIISWTCYDLSWPKSELAE